MATAKDRTNVLRGIAIVGGGLLLYKLLGRDVDPYITDPPHVTVEPTITAEQAQVIAEVIAAAIYADGTFWTDPLFGSLFEDERAVVLAMTLPTIRNDADVLLIADKYGVRSRPLTPNYTLFQAIHAYLEPSDIEDINAAYVQRGITITV